MARGFESKSVEEQQAEASRDHGQGRQLTPEQIEGRRQRDGLILSRKRIEQQLITALNPLHRQMLEGALAELDCRIATFGDL